MFRRLFCFFSLFLMAQTGAHAQPLPDRRPMTGIAVDSEGKSLSGALISVRRESDVGSATFWGASTASDARGNFRFPYAEVGRYFLSGELSGYASISNQWVVWNATSSPLRLRFERLVTLTLPVTRPDGLPAMNSSFWVRLRGDGNAGQTTRQVSSDAQGQISLPDLMPANYSIFAASTDGFALQRGVALRRNLSQPLSLQKGGQLSVLTREKGSQRPLGGAQLTLVPENEAQALKLGGDASDIEDDFGSLSARGDRLVTVSRDGDGRISLENVPPGRYRARVHLAGYETAPTQVVEIGAGLNREISWDLVPKPGSATSLTLQLSGAPANGAIAGEYALRLLRIAENGALEPEQDTPFSPGGHPGRRALADESGKIVLFPLIPGRYRVFVAPRTVGKELEDGRNEAASLDVSVPLSGATASLTLKP